MSEEPPGTVASAGRLVRRDRLQSGLSAAVIILQSDVRGGSMHTARFALIQGRELFVPLPSGVHAREAGCRALLALAEPPSLSLLASIGISEDLASRILRERAGRPLATPIRCRDDYPRLLDALETIVGE